MDSATTTTTMKRERNRRTRVGALIGEDRCTSSSRMVWPSSSAATAIVSRPMHSSTATKRDCIVTSSAGRIAPHNSPSEKSTSVIALMKNTATMRMYADSKSF